MLVLVCSRKKTMSDFKYGCHLVPSSLTCKYQLNYDGFCTAGRVCKSGVCPEGFSIEAR